MKKATNITSSWPQNMKYIINTLIITPFLQNTGRNLNSHSTNYKERISDSE